MLASPPMNLPLSAQPPAAALDTLAALMKAAGDPLRLEILRVLRDNAFAALELSDIFAMRQNAMSHHLKLLTRAGLVSFRREGTHIFYRRSTHHATHDPLREEILRAVDGCPLGDDIIQRIQRIEQDRAAASREF